MLQEIENDGQRFGVRYLEGVVDRRPFQVRRHPPLADPLGDRGAFRLELAVLVVIVKRRAHGIGDGDDDFGVALLERHADAGDGAAGADGADEAVHFTLGLLPDLRPGALEMGLAVGDVVELIGPDGAVGLLFVELFGEAAGIFDVVVVIGVRHGGHLDQLGAAQPQHVLLFLALGVGDDDHRTIAKGIADERQSDPGIAGGTLDDDAARFERPPLLGVHDDKKRRPVLHRTAGVEELRLAEDFTTGLLRGSLQPDQGRVADGVDEAVANVHGTIRGWCRCGPGRTRRRRLAGRRRPIKGTGAPPGPRPSTPSAGAIDRGSAPAIAGR